jgi:cytochrome o ubiquinol oxidase subunit 1
MTLLADSAIWGRLTLDAFRHDLIVTGAQLSVVGGLVAIIVLITYLKRWRWLWSEWLTSLDPKRIGVMYVVLAVVMLLRGVADLLMLRAQQALAASPNHGFLSPDHFQQIFTAHGTIMIFFVAMGLMFGLINLVLPLQLGARDVAFPFLNSVSFWLYAAGVVLVNVSLVVGEIGATGWLAYPPLSELRYSPGVGVDYWIWCIQISGVGSLLSGINFLATIMTMRRAGMNLMKMPLFAWGVANSMVLVVFAFPILTATLAMLTLDRTLGMHFFTSGSGGNPMMYVNLIWAWGHPEVYILILPAFGAFSEIVATFSSKRLFGYGSMVFAMAIITLLSYLVWLHHFFTMGAGANVNAFFGIMTMVIAIPTGVKVFNWIFTMYRGRVRFTTPMLWFLGFVVTFTIGGMAGVLMAVPSIDFQLHNSLFLVAHFHTMIIGGVIFGFFAALTYWFPKIFGFRLNETLGRWAFWCWLIGFLLAFTPLYILGMMGATRRLDHYDASLGWQGLFVVAGVGAGIIALGIGFQLAQLAYSIWKHHTTRDLNGDPWGGRTLEWSTTSPPPIYNFALLTPVSGRDPFWTAKQAGAPEPVKPNYTAIILPKPTPLGIYIGATAAVFGFAVIWHIWWLLPVCLVVLVSCLIVRSLDDEPEFSLSAAEVKRLEDAR